LPLNGNAATITEDPPDFPPRLELGKPGHLGRVRKLSLFGSAD
jgi:hypothetical protein